MAQFLIKPELLLVIAKSGQAKINRNILNNNLSCLESIVRLWQKGFSNETGKCQYDWEGEITIENFEAKSNIVPSEFKKQVRERQFSCNEPNRKAERVGINRSISHRRNNNEQS